MIEQAINSAFQAIADKFWAIWTPWAHALILFEWWALFILLVLVCLFVGFFLPFKWVRAILGGVIILAGAFVLGGTKMYRDTRPKVKEQQKQKIQNRQAPPERGIF